MRWFWGVGASRWGVWGDAACSRVLSLWGGGFCGVWGKGDSRHEACGTKMSSPCPSAGGCLYYVGPKKEEKREVIVDPERRRQVFLESHFTEIGNHLGQKKTVHRIQSRYYWLGIVKDVVDWVSAEHRLWLCHRRMPRGSGRRPQGAAGGALMQGGGLFLVLLL